MALSRTRSRPLALVAVLALLSVVVVLFAGNASRAGALTGTTGNVSVTVDPTTSLVDGQDIAVTASTTSGVMYQIQAHICLPGSNISNDFDFSFAGPFCAQGPGTLGAGNLEVTQAYGAATSGGITFKAGVGTISWTDSSPFDPQSHTMTCDETHMCDLVIQFQTSQAGAPFFFTAPLSYAPTAGTTTSTAAATTTSTAVATTTSTAAPTTTSTAAPTTTSTAAPTTTSTMAPTTTSTAAPTTTSTMAPTTTSTMAPTTTSTAAPTTTSTAAPTTTTSTAAPTTTSTAAPTTTSTAAPTTTSTAAPTTTSTAAASTSTTAGVTTTTTAGATTTTTAGATTTTTAGATTTTTAMSSTAIAVTPSTVAPGANIAVTSAGWQAGSDVIVTLHSTPVTLGTLVADSSGRVSGSFAVPAGTALGDHVVQLDGNSVSGSIQTLTAAITVVSASATTTTTSPAAVAATTGTLPVTGSDTGTLLTMAALLVGVGAGILLLGRRRQVAYGRD